VDGALDVAKDLQLHWVVQGASVLQEDEELAHDLGVGRPRVSPRQAAEGQADASDPAGGLRRHLVSP
jgi:hypothetical protein